MLIFKWFGESKSEEIHFSICEVLNWVKIKHKWILNLARQEKKKKILLPLVALFISCDLRRSMNLNGYPPFSTPLPHVKIALILLNYIIK